MKEEEFTRDISINEYNAKTLYYDLGYGYSEPEPVKESLDTDFTLYLLLVSLTQQFFFGILQIFTIFMIFTYFAVAYVIKRKDNQTISTYALILILIANVFDHIVASNTIPLGRIIGGNLTLIPWTLEILWTILFILQLMVVFQPNNTNYLSKQTLSPRSENAIKNFRTLKNRLEGGQYKVDEIHNYIDIRLLADNFKNMIKFFLTILSILILINILIWEFMDGLAGGRNIQEAYFVSGFALLILVMLLVFANLITNSEKGTEGNGKNSVEF